jgi:hypothetical protein
VAKRTAYSLEQCGSFFLGLRLLGHPLASAGAATIHHSRHVIARPSQGYAGPGWAYAAPRQPAHYDDTPSYDGPSKSGSDSALLVTH